MYKRQGTPEARPKEKAALALAEGPYSQALGLWYAGEKFSPEAKADVEHKVATMIEVYKDRLEKADWLAPETVSYTHLRWSLGRKADSPEVTSFPWTPFKQWE